MTSAGPKVEIWWHSKEYLISDGSISKITKYFSDGSSKKMLCFTGSYRNMRSYSLVKSRHVTPKPRLFNTEYNIMFGPARSGPFRP